MFSNEARRSPLSVATSSVYSVRIILKHPAERRPHVVLIEHHELGDWIQHARKHGFALQAESVGPDLPDAA
jgi:type II secretory pathway component PulL